MNKIYLDKIYNYCNTTYKNNYNNYLKSSNIIDFINIVKQTTSLNENDLFNKYNYFELNNYDSSIIFNELILISPLWYNISSNYELYSIINALLLVLNIEYFKEVNDKKKYILENAINLYLEQLNKFDIIDFHVIYSICKITNINLIIVNNSNITFYESKNTDKWIILIKVNNDYFPLINNINKYYNSSSMIITFFKDNQTKIMYNEEIINKLLNPTLSAKSNNVNNIIDNISADFVNDKLSNINNVKSNIINVENNIILIEKSNNIKNIIDNNLANNITNIQSNIINDGYIELATNENYALFISEAIENKKDIENKNVKKIKKDKNIFLTKTKQIKENNKNSLSESSVFNKTQNIELNELLKISSQINNKMLLNELQQISLKFGINICSGSTKTGKPKNKTKDILLKEITTFLENNINKK